MTVWCPGGIGTRAVHAPSRTAHCRRKAGVGRVATSVENRSHLAAPETGLSHVSRIMIWQSGKLLIKPSTAAQRRIRNRLRTEMRSLRGANARAVIKRLNPIIRGWAAYYRAVVSSEVFSALDAH